jgi:hypothetical protein
MHSVSVNIHLSRAVEAQTRTEIHLSDAKAVYLSAENSSNRQDQMTFSEIHDFCDRIQFERDEKGQDARIVICPAQDDDESFSAACLYLGAYLILNMGWELQSVLSAFRPEGHFSAGSDLSDRHMDCWRALDRAKTLGWLVDPASDIGPLFDVDEFSHYAHPANGSVHMSVPGKLLFFPTPASLPDNQLWADSIGDDGRTLRRFSAPFYADLLQDLGAAVVVCLGRSAPSDAAAMRAGGIETVDLDMSDGGASLLRGLDQLVTLERRAPEPVAVHSGAGAAWPGYLGTLVSAVMISRLGFDEGSAGAWLRMVSSWMAPGDDSDGPGQSTRTGSE